MKYVPPSVNETAFNCPHCGALAKQYWYRLKASELSKESPKPILATNDSFDWHFQDIEVPEDRRRLLELGEKFKSGRPFFHRHTEPNYAYIDAHNLNISRCYNCDDIALWIYDQLIYPETGDSLPPNADMPEEIRRDYDEANVILAKSPRGAAALLRLAIQKLCKELGEPGKNINTDISSLVAKGLDARVQKALDVVRVVGNEAVHPGQIDLRDDRKTAETLFLLVNLIVEKMISEPKHVDEVYALLPEEKLKAIEQRDKKAKT